MSDYRRWYVQGGTVFFTVVTYGRRGIFASSQACQLLGTEMRIVREELPFKTIAAVLLPDHLHMIWTLPRDDADYSLRWKRIKREFTVAWLAAGGEEAKTTQRQAARGTRGVWQKRFFEHQVRDEAELEALCDYIHNNPVKHGLVETPADWPRSTFHRFVERGHYEPDWGSSYREVDFGFAVE